MDRLTAMRQRDWARLFGLLCAAVGLGLSFVGYQGAQWDALICWLGALMLLRASVDVPAESRVAQVYGVLRLMSFMFAFAAVNRAQDGLAGAASGALGNWVLWAVAGLLVVIAALRKLPLWSGDRVWVDLVAMLAGAVFFWKYYHETESTEMALLRFLIAMAVILNLSPFLERDERGLAAGVGFGVGIGVLIATPGAPFLPTALGALVGTLGMVLLWRLRSRVKRETPPRA